MPVIRYRKQLLLLFIFLFCFITSQAAARSVDTISKPSVNHKDTLTLSAYQHFTQQIKSLSLDSLKALVKPYTPNTLSGLLYLELADRCLNEGTINPAKKRLFNENEALNYTYKALHLFSSNNDTLGLRLSFNNLAKIYLAQKKYSQAKWFILQSNTLSREKHDMANIITSLLKLSEIKIDNKDYQLARRDLNEALQLSVSNKYSYLEYTVLSLYATLYRGGKDYPEELIIKKKRDSLKNLILKNEQDSITSIAAASETLNKRRLDSIRLIYYSQMQALRKKYWIIGLITFTIIILGFALFVFKKYIRKV